MKYSWLRLFLFAPFFAHANANTDNIPYHCFGWKDNNSYHLANFSETNRKKEGILVDKALCQNYFISHNAELTVKPDKTGYKMTLISPYAVKDSNLILSWDTAIKNKPYLFMRRQIKDNHNMITSDVKAIQTINGYQINDSHSSQTFKSKLKFEIAATHRGMDNIVALRKHLNTFNNVLLFDEKIDIAIHEK
jgi:hypothetical protein